MQRTNKSASGTVISTRVVNGHVITARKVDGFILKSSEKLA